MFDCRQKVTLHCECDTLSEVKVCADVQRMGTTPNGDVFIPCGAECDVKSAKYGAARVRACAGWGLLYFYK
jgi:hypothetical protein